jgi:hypothetical protein
MTVPTRQRQASSRSVTAELVQQEPETLCTFGTTMPW